MSGDDPVTNPEAWQVVYLAGKPSPGVAEVTGWSRPSKIDVKDPVGGQGATETYRGQPPAKGKVKITLGHYRDESTPPGDDFDAYDDWVKLLAVDGTKGPVRGVDIRHPALQRLNPPVTSVIAEDVGQLELMAPGDSLYTAVLSLLEFRPAPAANATQTANGSTQTTNADGSKQAGGGDAPGTDPVGDANQQQIQQLLNQAQQV